MRRKARGDMEFSFDQLPRAIYELHNKMDRLIKLLEEKQLPIETDPVPLDVKQVADFLNIAVRTVYDKVYKRELPVYKKGRNLYFFKDELYGYIVSGKLKTSEELKRKAESLLTMQERKTGMTVRR